MIKFKKETGMDEIIEEYGAAITTMIGIIGGIAVVTGGISIYKEIIFNMLGSLMYRQDWSNVNNNEKYN